VITQARVLYGSGFDRTILDQAWMPTDYSGFLNAPWLKSSKWLEHS